MVTARDIANLRIDLKRMQEEARRSPLNPGYVKVMLDRVNTLRNQAYDTPYLRPLNAIYSFVEASFLHGAVASDAELELQLAPEDNFSAAL